MRVVEANEENGIEAVEADNAKRNQIFSIDGRRMTSDKNLPAGIYIINGKKVLMK